MASLDHSTLELATIHRAHNWEFADAAARTAYTATVDDLYKLALQVDDFSLWILIDDSPETWEQVSSGVGGSVTSVNTQTGVVVLDADDIDDTSTTNKFTTATEITKLSGIEALADVTDATNVDAAGAVMNSDSSTAGMSFVIDEDSFASDSNTKVPTQQSVKAYVTASVSGGGYTDEQAQDAVGTILVDSTSIDFTYADATPSITASVILEWFQDTAAAMLTGGTHTGITTTYQDSTGVIDLASANTIKSGITINIDGGGSVIANGSFALVKVPFACTVTGWEMVGNPSGSIIFEVYRAPTATPSTFTQISGSSDPTLSTATTAKDTSISGDWSDVTLDEGDWLKFLVAGAVTSTTLAAVALDITRVI